MEGYSGVRRGFLWEKSCQVAKMTKSLFSLCLVGALIGGFPGAVLAFFFAVGTGTGEAGCWLANLIFGVGGAYAGMLQAIAIRGQNRIRVVEVVLPAFLGLLCGMIGYVWFDWAISHADPPL
jgi:hypothetical protein